MGSGMGMGGGDQKGNRALSQARDISDPTLRMKWHVVVDTNVLHFSAEEDFEFFHTLQHGQKKVRDTVVPQQHSTIGCMAGFVSGHTNLRGVVCIIGDVYKCGSGVVGYPRVRRTIILTVCSRLFPRTWLSWSPSRWWRSWIGRRMSAVTRRRTA